MICTAKAAPPFPGNHKHASAKNQAAALKKAGVELHPPLPSKRLFSLHLNDFFALVVTAVRANLVRSLQLTALGAFGEPRNADFPNVGTSFVFSRFRRFSLWYRHFSTSLKVMIL